MKHEVLAIGAHPDDVELGCAGTLAKLTKSGYNVGIVDLTEGELGTRGTKEIRAKESALAARILGVKTRINLKLPDTEIETTRENLLKLIQLIRLFKPEIMLFPHWHDRHPDHYKAHQLCKDAWYYAGLKNIKTYNNGKIQSPWRPLTYFNYMMKLEFIPSIILDISDVYQIRKKAIRAYKSQFFNPKSKDPETLLSKKSFLDFLETRVKFYGQLIGVEYAEPLYSPKPLGVSNIFDLKFLHR